MAAAERQALEIAVRAVFERGGFCRVSLLPGKDEALAGTVIATGSRGETELVPLQDNFYEDILPPDLSAVLREGIEWQATGDVQYRWTLAGREIYVLAPHEHVNGYVSAARLVLGEEHVVLCTPERLAAAQGVIAESGSPAPTVVTEGDGLLSGWFGLRGVVPVRSIPQSANHDILNVLRPLPDIAIVFDGGIRLVRNTWLAGYPPRIHLRGDVSTVTELLIDGTTASRSGAGAYIAPGWDQVGEHLIWCANLSRTYQIREGLEEWEGWDAYRWSLGDAGGDGPQGATAICGPLLRPAVVATPRSAVRVMCVTNPVLIGATPGEIGYGQVRRDLRTNECVAAVPFEPVWALPANPLACDKRTARVIGLVLRPPIAAVSLSPSRGRCERQMVRAWYAAILDAARKGLAVEPDDGRSSALWNEYKRHAKTLRRGIR